MMEALGALASLRMKAPAVLSLSVLTGAVAATLARRDGASVLAALGAAAAHAALLQLSYVAALALRAAFRRRRR